MNAPRFQQTYCSQCGGKFGPGNAGHSHCSDHSQEVANGRTGDTVTPEDDDAKAWCQAELDRWVMQLVDSAPQQGPLAVPVPRQLLRRLIAEAKYAGVNHKDLQCVREAEYLLRVSATALSERSQ